MTTPGPFTPKEHPYEQIIWASTQKSINTGASGFGLRTYSRGLSPEEASEIVQKAMVNYSLPTSQKATESDIVASPLIEDRYPSLFTFRVVTLAGGRKVRVVGRTLYVVSDYGFFADIDSARRDGSNYIAHLAVFDSCPDITVLAAMMRQEKFLPVDKRLSPLNHEICDLLVGEPTFLPAGSVSSSSSDYDNGTFLTEVALALITARYRASHPAPDNSLQPGKIVVRLDDHRLPDLIHTISGLPEEFTRNLQFQANTMYYSGVPEDLDMIVVPTRNTTRIDEEFFIVADYTGSSPRTLNLLESPLFDRIRKHAAEGDTLSRDNIIALCARGGLDVPDPELAYWAMMLVKTDTIPAPGELEANRVTDLIGLKSLGPHERDILNDKINRYLNGFFKEDPYTAYTASTLREGLDLLTALVRKAPEMVRIYPESVKFVSACVFSNPDYLGKLFPDKSQDERFDAIVYILNEGSGKVSHHTVLESLRKTGNPHVWQEMLKYSPGADNTEILKALAASPMSGKATFSAKLFNPEKRKDVWLDALDNLTVAELRNIGFPEIVERWLANEDIKREFINNGTANRLLASPDLITPDTLDSLNLTVRIANKDTLTKVDEGDVAEAVFQYGVEDEYTEEMIRRWLEPTVTGSDFTRQMAFLHSIGSLKNLARWFEKYRWPLYKSEKSRQQAAVILIDKIFKGNKDEIERFSRHISDSGITDALRLNSGFGASLKRKFSGFFGKK